MDIKLIEQLIVMMKEHRVDQITFEGLVIVKTQHDNPQVAEEVEEVPKESEMDDEELLFHSTT